jgi:hypothetical protein
MPPRFVSVIVTHGRSVPVSIGGKMNRLSVGDKPAMIPYEIYIRYAHKLELVVDGQAIPRETTDINAGDVAGVETPAAPRLSELPKWPMRIGPEEYLGLYESRPDPSPTMLARLELARQIVAAKEAHG